MGTPALMAHSVRNVNTIRLAPSAVNYVTIGELSVTWREAMFEPDPALLEQSVAICRALVPLSEGKLVLEVTCLSPT